MERLFSRIVRAVREERRLTQGELGVRCGSSNPRAGQVLVSGWEGGTHPLTESTMDRVAKALELSTAELFKEGLALLDRKEGISR